MYPLIFNEFFVLSDCAKLPPETKDSMANNVFFIFRPIKHGLPFLEMEDGGTLEVTEQTTILQVEKQRSGKPNVNIILEFHGKTSEFKSPNGTSTQSQEILPISPITLTNDETLPF